MTMISSPTARPRSPSTAVALTSSHASGAPSDPCLGARLRSLSSDRISPTGRSWRFMLLLRCVAAAPFPECLDHRSEAPALGREVILEPRWVLAVHPPGDQPARFHVLQPRGQRVGRDPRQRLLEIREAAWSVENKIAQDQNRPALADQIERARDRTVLLSIGTAHEDIVAM